MDLPRSAEGFYQDTFHRVALRRAERDRRSARRDHRLGHTTYRDLRATLKDHRKTVNRLETSTANLRALYTTPPSI